MSTTFKRRLLRCACCGLLTVLALAGVNRVCAEEGAQDDVAQAKQKLADSQERGLQLLKSVIPTMTRDDWGTFRHSERNGARLRAPSKAEAFAVYFVREKACSDSVNSAVQSIKIVPSLDGGKSAVRVLYRDGSVIYYDGDNLEGKTEWETALSDTEIDAIPEFDCGPGGYLNWVQAHYEACREYWNLKSASTPRDLEPDWANVKERLAKKRNESLERLLSFGNGDDRRLVLEAIAGNFAQEREDLSRDKTRKPAIQSIKIVPLDSAKKYASTYGAVRVLFSDGSVKYYDEDELDGEREPANAPDEEVVAKTLEFVLAIGTPWPEGYAASVKRRLSMSETEATK